MPSLPIGSHSLLEMNAMSLTAGIASVRLAKARAQEVLGKETEWEPWGSSARWLASLGLFIGLPSDGSSYSERAISSEEGRGVQQPGPKEQEVLPISIPPCLFFHQDFPKSARLGQIPSDSRKAFPDLRAVQQELYLGQALLPPELRCGLTVHTPLVPVLRRQR